MTKICDTRPIDRSYQGTRCKTCGVERPHGSVWGPICECERTEAETLMAAYVVEHRARVVAEIREAASVSARFQRCTIENFERQPGTEEALGAVLGWLERYQLGSSEGFLLSGPFGSGKTHLAAAALHGAIERTLVHGRFVSAGALVAEVRSGEGKRVIDYAPVERAIEAELLVLDDLGQEAGTDFARDVVTRVVMKRYDCTRPTIFTSNRDPKGMEAVLGGAIVSRIMEMGRTHFMLADDYRQLRRRA